MQSVAASAAPQVVVSALTVAWIVPIRQHLVQHPGRVAVWLLLDVLVVLVMSGLLVARLSDEVFPAALSPGAYGRGRRIAAAILRSPAPPTVWDWLFTNRPPNEKLVLVERKDGSRVGGVFAAGSLALTYPETRGLFLSEEWLPSDVGDFESPIPGSSGLLLDDLNEMRWVRILDPGPDLEQQGEGDPHDNEINQDPPAGAAGTVSPTCQEPTHQGHGAGPGEGAPGPPHRSAPHLLRQNDLIRGLRPCRPEARRSAAARVDAPGATFTQVRTRLTLGFRAAGGQPAVNLAGALIAATAIGLHRPA